MKPKATRHVTWCSISALFSCIRKSIRDLEDGDQNFFFDWCDSLLFLFFVFPFKTNTGKVLVRMSLDYNLLWSLLVTHGLTLSLSWLGRLMSFSEVAIPVHIYTMIYFALPPPNLM